MPRIGREETKDEMVRGVYLSGARSEKLTVSATLKRYLAEVSTTQKRTTQRSERFTSQHSTLAIKSGMRSSEITGLRLSQVDVERRIVRLSDRGGLSTNSINIQNRNFTGAARATPAAGEVTAFARLSALFDLPAANPAVIAKGGEGRTVVPAVADVELAKIRTIRSTREERGRGG